MIGKPSIEDRLRRLEDQVAIYQAICGYGYAVDGRNAEAVGSFYAKDGVYAVGDVGVYEGRDRVAAITQSPPHVALVNTGCAHVSSLPYVVVDGDKAVATCHTVVMRNGDDGFSIYRLSASRIQLSRKSGGGWEIEHRQNHLLNGAPDGPAQLARLKEGPARS